MVFSIFYAFLRDEVYKTDYAQVDLDLDCLHMPLDIIFLVWNSKKGSNTELNLPADLTFPF